MLQTTDCGEKVIKMSKLAIGLVCAVLCVVSSVSSICQYDTYVSPVHPNVLKGLKEVYVLVEGISEEIENEGLRSDDIKTETEVALRQTGLLVSDDAKSPVYLYINVNAMKDRERGVYVFSTGVQLHEDVRLVRNMERTVIGAMTWKTPRIIGMLESGNLRSIRGYTRDQVARFCLAYQRANPKPQVP